MSRWLSARTKAFQVCRDIEMKYGKKLYGEELIEVIINDQNILCLEVPSSDSLLADQDGNSQARYYAEEQYIVIQKDLPQTIRTLLKAHELGHHFLHTRQAVYSTNNIDPAALILTLPYAEGRIATYNSRQTQEYEATVFAYELLIPSERLAALFDAGYNVTELITEFQTSELILFTQMATALLVPLPNYEKLLCQADLPPFRWTDLDESQRLACCEPKGPVLVQAGPGTGKTRTLTSRIEWLIAERNTPPERILVLTFSNKATDELRLRLRTTLPTIAHQVTVTTFHGFGLELLRRYSEKAGLPPDIRVLDPLEAEMILEAHLDTLDLNHFSDPTNPDHFLEEMVKNFSQAKENLIDVATYENLVHQLSSRNPGNIAPEVIEQLLELSRVYSRYDDILRKEGFVDYGDLVAKPVFLLRSQTDVLQQLRAQYTHILVDEYQDINHANGELIQLLVGEDGDGLWVVGDLRQCIYRWRGATPEYLATFRKQYPHAVEHFLDINYRSSEALVNLVSLVASQMNLPKPARQWRSHRGPSVQSPIKIAVANDRKSELNGIGETIKTFVLEGATYANIAILCRTNGQAREIATALDDFGIPTLHLGRFFFRPEVKDLLSVLALMVDKESTSWIRVGALLRQPLQVEGAAQMWHQTEMASTPFPDALRKLINNSNLAPTQIVDISYMASYVERHLSQGTSDPWRVLCEFLFDYGHYLRHLRTGDRSDKQQVLLAISQLLNLANAFRQRKPIGNDNQPIRTMLNYVRRAIKRDDNDIDLPISELEIDAIRILTIHKAKGLEFPIVFVPNLAKGRFPSRLYSDGTLPKLEWLIHKEIANEANLEEESCLFVSISRARDHLIISRADSYSQRLGKPTMSTPSVLWQLLQRALNTLTLHTQSITWVQTSQTNFKVRNLGVEDKESLDEKPFHLDFQSLRVYQRCPRQYYYRYSLGLAITDERDIYGQFQRLIYQIAEWLGSEFAHSRWIEWQVVHESTEQRFRVNLPQNHTHTAWYRQQLERIIHKLWVRHVEQNQSSGTQRNQVTAQIAIEGVHVTFQIDEIIETKENFVINLFRMGRVAKSHLEHPLPALCRKYAQSQTKLPVKVQLHYLTTGNVQIVPGDKDGKALQRISEDSLRIQRNHFPPQPTDSRFELTCGRCSFLFICPGGGVVQAQGETDIS